MRSQESSEESSLSGRSWCHRGRASGYAAAPVPRGGSTVRLFWSTIRTLLPKVHRAATGVAAIEGHCKDLAADLLCNLRLAGLGNHDKNLAVVMLPCCRTDMFVVGSCCKLGDDVNESGHLCDNKLPIRLIKTDLEAHTALGTHDKSKSHPWDLCCRQCGCYGCENPHLLMQTSEIERLLPCLGNAKTGENRSRWRP